MTYNMLRRTKSSSLLPIVRLTNYFYPDTAASVEKPGFSATTTTVDVYARRSVSGGSSASAGREGSLTPPPDYEQLYQAMQLDNFEGLQEERVRKKYACQGLKLVASALAEDSSALSNREVGFSRDLYVNGVEYILRGLPSDLSPSERQRIHTLLRKLAPLPSSQDQYLQEGGSEPYPLLIFLFRQLGMLLKTLAPHVQSLALRLVEMEQKHGVLRGGLEVGLGVCERGVDIAVKLGLNDALVGFAGALGRGVGESWRVYKES